MPSPCVQRNASKLEIGSPCIVMKALPRPTTTEPSAETPFAVLLKSAPGRSPRPIKYGAVASAETHQMVNHRTAAPTHRNFYVRVMGYTRGSSLWKLIVVARTCDSAAFLTSCPPFPLPPVRARRGRTSPARALSRQEALPRRADSGSVN